MPNLIAREREQHRLQVAFNSKDAEFVAIYGRRRIGKTYLVRQLFANQQYYFEVTGLKNGSLNSQLQNFSDAFSRKFHNSLALKPPTSWSEAFTIMTKQIKKIPSYKKIVIFLDELPWLASKRSNFLQSLDYSWNTQWSQYSNLLLIVCGSAASWMLEKLIYAKGGLHNRLTHSLLLEPFTLKETEKFFKSRSIRLNRFQVLEIYMAIGGIPHYLKQIEKGLSAAENIDQLCFQKDSLLYNEFYKLFPALFDDPEISQLLLRIISKNRYGISRTQLIKVAKISSGGTLNKRINELEAAGFIQSFFSYQKKKDIYYRIIDEYTLFFIKWIYPLIKSLPQGNSYWVQKSQTPAFQSWAGYTFETICLKHSLQIKKALNLENISCEIGSWRLVPKPGEDFDGAQIDLLFDRVDGVINLCEIKHTQQKFQIDKVYGRQLIKKIEVFEKYFKTNKQSQVFLSLISPFGIKKNIWSEELINQSITLDDLFE